MRRSLLFSRFLPSSMKLRNAFVILLSSLMLLSGCSQAVKDSNDAKPETVKPQENGAKTEITKTAAVIDEQPSTVYYEIFVRSFNDSNGDGIGDLKGVTEKLDYLKDLGVGGIWLMPINPSPSYHGYDVTDYYAVNPQYGTMDDLKVLLDEAHKRDIKVIMDLVVNHTSKEHPWFKKSAADPKSSYRSWYTWATPNQTLPSDGAAGGIPWHPNGKDHYLGIFWEGMPDLNFDNPDVRREMIKVGQFWLKQGLDGFRLDAAKHIYEKFKSTASKPEIKKKNQIWWQEFCQGLNEVKQDAYLVGEVWDSTATIGPYLDHALDSCFNFDLAKTLLSSARSEKSTDIAFSLSRVYDYYNKSSQGAFVDAPFLSNHDQTRVMSELEGNVNHAKMAASLLLTLPGNPFIYYGEEIGMLGMKPDERLREPMVWSDVSSGGAQKGQTRWEKPFYNAESKVVPVAAQLKDENSLLNLYKKLISWRNEDQVLGDGGIASYDLKNDSIVSFIRATAKEQRLVVHNLSKDKQTISLPDQTFASLILFSKPGIVLKDGMLELPPYSTAILK